MWVGGQSSNVNLVKTFGSGTNAAEQKERASQREGPSSASPGCTHVEMPGNSSRLSEISLFQLCKVIEKF